MELRQRNALNRTRKAGVAQCRRRALLAIPGWFRSIHDSQLFYMHSRWKDEVAFEYHVTLPHTLRFVTRVEPLLDHPLDVSRAGQIAESSSPGLVRRGWAVSTKGS